MKLFLNERNISARNMIIYAYVNYYIFNVLLRWWTMIQY